MDTVTLESMLEKYKNHKYNSLEVKNKLSGEIEKNERKIIVLDDDPTGVQTIHDIYVYTDWSEETIRKGFKAPEKLFCILTNSRSLTEEQTTVLHREIARNIIKVSKEENQDFLIISRGDSTLRGHYPLETQILKDNLEQAGKVIHGEILFPFFKEGGRFTAEDIHYVKKEDELIPAGETEFAGDKTFGFTKSNLCQYIEEKTEGKFKAEKVTSISLKSLRNLEYDVITEQLLKLENFDKAIVNALDYQDVEVFCVSLFRALKNGKNFMFRTAASFLKVIGGISDIPLLTRADMIKTEENHGGMIVVGSHTAKTTEQLNELKSLPNLEFIEFNSDFVLEDKLEEEVIRVVNLCENLIKKGTTAAVYTRRKLLTLKEDTPEKALLRSVKISEAVQELVGRLTIKPDFVLAKGGITSSDVGVKALKVKEAFILGQVKPGIPVWKTDEESKFPGIPYIIFPGNVGEKNTLKEVVQVLQGE